MLSTRRSRGLVILVTVSAAILSSLIWWTWASLRADREAQQEAIVLNLALKGMRPDQILADSGRSLRRKVNLVTLYGDSGNVVLQVQPRSFPRIRCVVANLDASGHYDIEIRHSGCRSG